MSDAPHQHLPPPGMLPLDEAVIVDTAPPPERVFLPIVLALVTCCTTTLAGFLLRGIISGAEPAYGLSDLAADPTLIRLGLPFSATLLAILLAHELGHYLACRYYGIRATLPYLIPGPPLPFGTFGAVIRIKSPFLNSRQLFDVGVAGPLAGMIFAAPAALFGLAWSQPLVGEPQSGAGFVVGFPLLFKWAVQLFHGGGSLSNLHLVACAAWFGALATSFNLIPVGQLDGGHIVYSVFGARWHRIVSLVGWTALITAGLLLWPGYLVFAVVLVFVGFRHPAPVIPGGRLGPGRLWLALVGLIIFVITIVPTPLRFVDDIASF